MDNPAGKKEPGSTFWKERTKCVPGRPTLRIEVKSNNQLKSSSGSFRVFQESVRDAWDIGDEVCEASRKVPMTINNDSRNTPRLPTEPQTPPQSTSAAETSPKEPSVDFVRSSDCKEAVVSRLKSTDQMESLEGTVVDCGEFNGSEIPTSKLGKLRSLLESAEPILDDLRRLSWSGVPAEVRPTVWRILAAYVPTGADRRELTLKRKRTEYWKLVDKYFYIEEGECQETYRQIHIDIPRMAPVMTMFQQRTVQEMFERILFLWAIRHPASGYVQGMNDLVTPFFVVFLQEFLPCCDLNEVNVDVLSKEDRDAVEADCFWCFSSFLDVVQDNYVFAQLGVQRKIGQLKGLVERVDRRVHDHLQVNGVDYLQFSFRWMNNLLTREIPLRCCLRLWDTYLAEADSFAAFHPYVCAAFLLRWRRELLAEQDFQGLMILLQNLPTQQWSDADIDLLLAEAYRLRFSFADAPKHIQTCENS